MQFLSHGCRPATFFLHGGLVEKTIRLSEVHKKTGAELVSNGIVGRNLRTKQEVPSQVPPHNAIVDEFGTSLLLNLGKANRLRENAHTCYCFLNKDCLNVSGPDVKSSLKSS